MCSCYHLNFQQRYKKRIPSFICVTNESSILYCLPLLPKKKKLKHRKKLNVYAGNTDYKYYCFKQNISVLDIYLYYTNNKLEVSIGSSLRQLNNHVFNRMNRAIFQDLFLLRFWACFRPHVYDFSALLPKKFSIRFVIKID